MKICTKCKEEKELVNFNKNATRKDGYQTICKLCSRARSRLYYKENKKKHIEVIRKRKKLTEKKLRDYLFQKLADGYCTECGETDPLTLEFDHIDPDYKFYNISKIPYLSFSLVRLNKELEKCRILCANCHNKHTHKQFNTYRYQYFTGL